MTPLASQGVQAWDRYAYANNNPVRYIDPTGHMVDNGCQSEGCSSTSGSEYRDYLYNIIHNGYERRQNTATIETAVEIIEVTISIAYEPGDWVLTLADCVIDGHCSPWMLLGVLPLIPGSTGDEIGEALSLASKRFTDDQETLIDLAQEAKKKGGITEEEAQVLLDWAEEYILRPLSKGIEIHPNRNFNIPHIRIGPINHIPIIPGLGPR